LRRIVAGSWYHPGNGSDSHLYEVKLVPFIELGFKPDQISLKHGALVFTNDNEIQFLPTDEYERLMGTFMKHIVNRYGIEEINRWRFEMRAPVDDDFMYSEADIDMYIEQFAGIKKVIKNIAPKALVGGPGFNLGKPEYLDIMNKILYGLKEKDSSPDFFSFYSFSFSEMPPNAEPSKDQPLLLWGKDEILKRIAWAKEFIQANNPHIKHFFVTEWNLDFSCRNRLHDSLLKAPFILQNCIDAIAANETLAYWIASDISAEYSDSGAILFGGAGLISRHGIRKPAFFAYQFLSRLGRTLLTKGNSFIVTAKSESEYAAIVFNYKYVSNDARLRNDFQYLSRAPALFFENREKLTLSLCLSNTPPGKYKIRRHLLNAAHGSIYDAWKSLSSIQELSAAEAAWLERTCIPGPAR
jgi:beta-xylosidase